jgi:hypothetical protein
LVPISHHPGQAAGVHRSDERQLFIIEGKGGHQRLVPISPTFFSTVAKELNHQQPVDGGTDRLFVALEGPRRGQPLSVDGLDEEFSAARPGPNSPTGPATNCATRASPG